MGEGRKERKAFTALKKLVLSSELLVHFNLKLEVMLACDASSWVGAILAYKMPDGTERLVNRE